MTAPVTSTAASSQLAQAGLAELTAASVAQAWAAIDPHNLRATLPDFNAVVAANVRRYGATSGALAARLYRQIRLEHVRGSYTPRPANLPPMVKIVSGLNWATGHLFGETQDMDSGLTLAIGVAERLVMDVGRDTIRENVHNDSKAKGWARVTEPGPCAFCALLAMRGFVYKESSASFHSHDKCRCHAEPIFGEYRPGEQVAEWASLYKEATRSASGKDKRTEWRRAFDAAYGK